VVTVVIDGWVGELDSPQVGRRVLRGEAPFDESTMLDEDAHGVLTTDRDRSVAVAAGAAYGGASPPA
jgi:hypothetical protein